MFMVAEWRPSDGQQSKCSVLAKAGFDLVRPAAPNRRRVKGQPGSSVQRFRGEPVLRLGCFSLLFEAAIKSVREFERM